MIPNWNGKQHLPRCIAAALASVRECKLASELIVVDDASSDGSGQEAAAQFPSIRLIDSAVNRGFAASCRAGIKAAEGEVIVLLNNDLVAKPALIAELCETVLSDSKVFGATGLTLDWNSQLPNHVSMAARWVDGGFRLYYDKPREPSPTMFLQGGCCAMRRNLYLEWGGFLEIFKPGYWEDYDLSYFALKAGYHNVYNPRAAAYHFGQGSMLRAHGSDHIRAVRLRNRFLFTWMNLTDEKLLREHCRSLPQEATRGDRPLSRLMAVGRAARLLGEIAKQREFRAPRLVRSDAEVLAEFTVFGAPVPGDGE